MQKFTLIFASISMAMSIALGAFGAHILKGMVTASRLQTFHTGVTYQVYHSLGLLFIAVLMSQIDKRFLQPVAIMMMVGIMLFSGSLYLLVLMDKSSVGMVTPIGGLTLIISWMWLAIVIFTRFNQNEGYT